MNVVCIRIGSVQGIGGEAHWFWRCYSCQKASSATDKDISRVIKDARRHVNSCERPTTNFTPSPDKEYQHWLIGFK